MSAFGFRNTRDTSEELAERSAIARALLARGAEPIDSEPQPESEGPLPDAARTADLGIPFPDGLAPVPQPPNPGTDTRAPLPQADAIVITWTVDEHTALADVLTPGFGRATWTRYDRNFEEHYVKLIRPGAPSIGAHRLGSWLITRIGQKSALCFKSELHLNQDGIRDGVAPGVATLPVKDLFKQLIDEVQPQVILTAGTSGGLFLEHDLGDVVVTRAAKFRLKSEFRNAPFNGTTYKSEWDIPTQHLDEATGLMQAFAPNLVEPPLLAPTARHTGQPFVAPTYVPDVKQDGKDGLPEFHPVLTTDYFEFGTSTNHLEQEGCAVEMGDAVLGLACSELPNPPHWAVVRNLSDPQINGLLEKDLQVNYAVWYYQKYGYWTSIMSSLAAWAIVAGL